MNIALSGIKERLIAEGYSPVRFARLFIRLALAFLTFITLTTAEKVIDYYFRFPGRSLSRGMLERFVRTPDVGSLLGIWLIFALVATLLAVVINGFGWRDRRPKLSAWLVRLGVFVILFASYAVTMPPHMSRYSYYGLLFVLISGLIVGFVVESVKLGRRPVAVTE
jgi:hypothetical protein